ncbi:MAG: VanZ family protein [Bacteroidetes bacterium]|jgi:glycopeptide antibiotics resistance protein|nr:VanZ family protein [Bacteroidota bacterium]MBK9320186.1 VanZ family protein [Bacteroidota bacterium]
MPTKHWSVPDSLNKSFLKYNWPGISWALLILILSTITPPSFTIPQLFDLFAPDKVAHFVFYAVYVILFTYSFSKMPVETRWTRNQFSIPLFSGAIYGGLIELYQGYILSDRIADWVDFLANSIGALMGWIVMRIWSGFQKKAG